MRAAHTFAAHYSTFLLLMYDRDAHLFPCTNEKRQTGAAANDEIDNKRVAHRYSLPPT